MKIAHTQNNQSLKTLVDFRQYLNVFSADSHYTRPILAGVFFWFLLAQIFVFFIPDTTTTFSKNSSQYLDYVIRNGQFYLIFIFALSMLKLLKASEESGKGQSALPFIQEKIGASIRADKNQLLGIPLYFIMAALIFAAYLFSYSTIKTRIPNVVPYMWDVQFYNLDRFIFFGRDPWQYFSFLYDYPKIIVVMDFVYDLWAAILVSCWFFSLRYGGENKKRRYQFVMALLLTWFIGGNVLAIALSSGGPVYFEALTGLPSSYSDQMAHLAAINEISPLRAFEYQNLLWDIYQSPSVGLGGISAMPSMHCASSLLLLFMFGRNKIMRPILIAFCLFIFIASFVLAWHYAVDGLLAIPLTLTTWYGSGWIIDKLSQTNQVS